MPLYEYQCDACEHRFEKIQKFSDPLVDTCPTCGGHVRKLPSSPAIQFKGSGFYITDYPKKDQGGASKNEKTDSKTDSKADSGGDKGDKSDKKDSSTTTTKTEKTDTKTSSSGDTAPSPTPSKS